MTQRSSKEQIALQLAQTLSVRLERISADSIWARRASGLRGSLLRELERSRLGKSVDFSKLAEVTRKGFDILQKAAQEYSRD